MVAMARSPMARSTMARSQVVERVKATDSLQILYGSHFARFLRIRRFLSHRCRVQTSANVVHATGEVKTEHLVARTFFWVLLVFRTWKHFHTCTRARGSSSRPRHDWDVLHTCAPSWKSSYSHSMQVSQSAPWRAWPISIILFHATAVDTELTANDWNQVTPCAPSAGRDAVWPSGWIISWAHRLWGQDLNIEENNDLTTTVAASENSNGFHQQAAASGSPQQVPASVVNPRLSADMWSSTRKN